MTEMIEVKIADLTGSALNWAVAMADGWESDRPQDGQVRRGSEVRLCGYRGDDPNTKRYAFNPSTDWAHGGPLLERYQFGFLHLFRGRSYSMVRVSGDEYIHGDTLLQAICRAVVAHELDDPVLVPAALLAEKCHT